MSGRNTSFYYSFLCLPRERREAIIAVWDFCRAVDDAVDEAEPVAGGTAAQGAKLAIERWRRELAACYGEGTPATSQGRSLAPHVRRFSLRRDAFDAIVEGVEMDLHLRRYETFEALKEYCLRVASAVGLVCVDVFGCRDPRARDYAVDLGIALQLTNIVRDVAGDLARDRVYLPQEDLRRFACTEDDLRRGVVTGPVRALLAYECARARDYYRRAESGLPRVERRRLVAARIMGAIYLDVLRRIERSNYDVFSRVARAPRRVRARIAATTWAGTMLGLR